MDTNSSILTDGGAEVNLDYLIPDPNHIIGTCPECGQPVVANMHHLGGVTGYVRVGMCWNPLCDYARPA
jgi:hypothetical protein